jgi:NADPH2:quinone reductase
MRAITYNRFGPADEVLTLMDLHTPTPAAGEVLVRLHASAVNPSDVKARAGSRPGVTKPPFPMIIPHSDGAGVIEAVGEGVDPARIGARVWIWNGQWGRAHGTAAEYIALPSAQAVELPQNTSFAAGAVLGIPGLTACHTVLGGGSVKGKRLLVSGAAGSVGHLAVQIAVAHGAEVFATARGAAGLDAARSAGAAHVFDYGDPDLPDQILAASNGALMDRIVEVEFGKNIATDTAVIAAGGTIAAYGSAKDMTPTIPFYPLMFKAVRIDLALIYLLDDRERAARIAELTALLEAGALDIRIAAEMPLEDCAKAHRLVEAGDRQGAVVLKL